MNLPELAQQAVTLLRPELLLLAGKAAAGAATESGKQLLTWRRERVQGKPAEAALEDAAAHPDDCLRLQSLQLQIQLLIRENDSYRQQLEALLTVFPQTTTTNQVATATGGSKIAQVFGTEHKTSIR
jgi:hypothetical protein